MDNNYAWALAMTFIYSIIGFINRNSNPEQKENLKKKINWINAISKATLDAGFAILFFSGLTHFYPDWHMILRIASSVFLAVFIAETFVDTIKEKITKWKI
jgi:hypothetical protein